MGRQYFTDIIASFNYCDIIGLQSYQTRWKKAKLGLLRPSRSFKVTEVSTNRKPVCNFLLVINSNWHLISYRVEVIAASCSNFGHCIFEPRFGGLRTMFRCSSWVHWKARSGLPISVNWTSFARCYSWGAMSENISKISDFAQMWPVWPKISGRRGCPPPTIFLLRKLS